MTACRRKHTCAVPAANRYAPGIMASGGSLEIENENETQWHEHAGKALSRAMHADRTLGLSRLGLREPREPKLTYNQHDPRKPEMRVGGPADTKSSSRIYPFLINMYGAAISCA